MRYLLDNEGYIAVASSNRIECDSKYCIGYKGTIPDGYSSLEEWATTANIRAYYIDDNGNLTLDQARLETLENCLTHKINCHSEEEKIVGEFFGKPIYEKSIYYAAADGQKFVPNHNIENFEGIVDARGRFTRVSTGIQCLIPMNYTSWESFVYDFTATNYVLRWSDNQWAQGVKDIYITLQYTKTTDLPKIEFVGNDTPEIEEDEDQEEITRNIVIADSWVNYNNGSPDGIMTRDGLDIWFYNWDESSKVLDGVALDFTIEGKYTLYGNFTCESYEGAPRDFGIYIFKDGTLYKEIPYKFDSLGSAIEITINEELTTGTYQLVIGAYPDYEFGIICNSLYFK